MRSVFARRVGVATVGYGQTALPLRGRFAVGSVSVLAQTALTGGAAAGSFAEPLRWAVALTQTVRVSSVRRLPLSGVEARR